MGTLSSPPSAIIDLAHAPPPIAHGIQLVSPRQALPDKCFNIFPFPLFNAVQSKCFPSIFGSNDNAVISAPTGSGKTAILEMAICRLAVHRGNANFKIVYQAPTKALCSERARDWDKKFSHMGLYCAELTGDTSQAEMRRVGRASIIVTTPEKWDSVTRKWDDHRKLLHMVELFLIDEVHILKDIRGATLEAVVSRMKTIRANIRFVALSATVPNSEDIATWLGRDHARPDEPALREKFGEDLRPVKLQKFVYGYDHRGNDFNFDAFLDQKLPILLAKHTCYKPILIFCFTRQSCESTARKLAQSWSDMTSGGKLWSAPSRSIPVVSKELAQLIPYGVAFHHAGLDVQDRNTVAQSFLDGQLSLICCTTTLAVGVNLPCHTVVLKGTIGYQNDRLQEYSDLEVMQMLGRAGRPQFDDSANAIILTRSGNKARYEKMVSGEEVLESTLHVHLIEHLNSEIGLGTICDIPSAQRWLSGTFLSVRLRRNPARYGLTPSSSSVQQIGNRLAEICERDVKLLQEAQLVTPGPSLACTEYGRAMSKYMVEFNTMKLLLSIPRGVKMEQMITIICQASEFKDFRFKPAERTLFRELNNDPFIVYPIKDAVSQTWHKISLLINVPLGGVQFPDSKETAPLKRQFMSQKKAVFERMQRLVRALIDCKRHDMDAVGTKTALELFRSLAAEAWERRPTQLLQIPGIGPVGMRKLISQGVKTVVELAGKDYGDIERLLSRNPPYGKQMADTISKFPRLKLDTRINAIRKSPTSCGTDGLVVLHVLAVLSHHHGRASPKWINKYPSITFMAETSAGRLAHFWRGSLQDVAGDHGRDLRFSVSISSPDELVRCHLSCEEIVGTLISQELKPSVPKSLFCVTKHFFSTAQSPAVADTPSCIAQCGDKVFDNDEINDDDLVDLVRLVEEPRREADDGIYDDDGDDAWAEVEDLMSRTSRLRTELRASDHDPSGRLSPSDVHDAIRLPNGRWQCNHPCTGDYLTRAGKSCGHRCCREGLDRPPKPRIRATGAYDKKRNADDEDASWSCAPDASTSTPGRNVANSMMNPSSTDEIWDDVADFPFLASSPAPARKRPRTNSTHHGPKDSEIECIDLSMIDESKNSSSHTLGSSNPSRPMALSATSKDARHPRRSSIGSQSGSDVEIIKVNTIASHETKNRNDEGLLSQICWENMGFDDDEDFDYSANHILEDEMANTASESQHLSKPNLGGIFSSSPSFLPPKKQQVDGEFARCLSPAECPDGTGTRAALYDVGEKRVAELAASKARGHTPQDQASTPLGEKAEEHCGRNDLNAMTMKQVGDPEWVNEFDSDFINMFRGFVRFV